MTSKQDLKIKAEPGEPPHCSIQVPGHYGSKCRNELTEKLSKPRKKTCTLDGFTVLLCTECSQPMGHVDFNTKFAHHTNCHPQATLNQLKTLQESYCALQQSMIDQLATKDIQIAAQLLEIELLKVANSSKNTGDQQDQDHELSPILPLNDEMDLKLTSNILIQLVENERSDESDGPTAPKQCTPGP